MAVNMYDAWGLANPEHLPKIEHASPQTSAKKAQIVERELAKSSVRGELIPQTVEDETPPSAPIEFTELLSHVQNIYHEMQSGRQEESKRFTVYLLVSAILCAILFMYIERLQRQVSNLNNMLHLHQMQPSLFRQTQELPIGIARSLFP